MEAERINLIGTTLADLTSTDCQELRGIFDYDAKAERLRTVNASLEDPTRLERPQESPGTGQGKEDARWRGRHPRTT